MTYTTRFFSMVGVIRYRGGGCLTLMGRGTVVCGNNVARLPNQYGLKVEDASIQVREDFIVHVGCTRNLQYPSHYENTCPYNVDR